MSWSGLICVSIAAEAMPVIFSGCAPGDFKPVSCVPDLPRIAGHFLGG